MTLNYYQGRIFQCFSRRLPRAFRPHPPRTMATLQAAVIVMSLVALATIGFGTTDALAAPGDFVTVWTTTNATEAITFPGIGTYTINWGDGTTDQDVIDGQNHTYAIADDYTVTVSGNLVQISNDCLPNAEKLTSIEQWGDIRWNSMHNAFCGASQMTYDATDKPDLSGVSNMEDMFRDTSFTGNLSSWDVSSVTNMHGMFSSSSSFNGDLSSWKVSSVTDMSDMFNGASFFDGDLSSWDVSSVTNMTEMFTYAAFFNGTLSSWDVSSVTDMSGMFFGAVSFNQPLSSWDVSSVTDMSDMFTYASDFNQPLSSWDVSSVTDMSGMFHYATSFKGDLLARWAVSSVTDMSGMFHYATSFNGDLSRWDVSSVENMSDMFNGASSFNGDLSSWDVSSVENMEYMFNGASSFDQNLGNWHVVPADTAYATSEGTLNVTTISAQNAVLDNRLLSYGIGSGGNSTLFEISYPNALIFKSTPSTGIYTVNVTVSSSLIPGGNNDWRLLEIRVTGQTTDTISPVIILTGDNPTVLTVGNTYTEQGAICDDNVDADKPATPSGTVDINTVGSYTVTYSCTDTAGNDAASVTRTVRVDAASVTTPLIAGAFVTTWKMDSANQTITIPATGTYMIDWGDGTINANVTGTQTHTYADAGNYAVQITGGLTGFHLSNAADAPKLVSLDQWGAASWASMAQAFRGAFNMVYNAVDSPDLSSVTDMYSMFRDAAAFNGDLSRWDVSSVTDMSYMFSGTSSFNGDLSSWNVSSVTDMSSMFSFASSFNGDLSRWDVSSVENMDYMFDYASSFNGDLSSWNVSSATHMSNMFTGANLFDQNLGNWYVVPADTTYATSEGTLNVTTISAQNAVLDNPSLLYGIGIDSGGNSNLFNITDSKTLMFKNATSTGIYTVNVTASGGSVFESGNHWRVFAVRVSGDPNAPLVLTAIGSKSVNELVPLEFNAMATYADNNALSFSLETGFPSGASITSAGAFSWTPTERQDGDTSITVKVSDNMGGTDSDTFTVTVNEVDTAPVLDTITSKNAVISNTLTFTATASDDDYRVNVADTATFSLTDPIPSGASITPAGVFSWTPTANQTGSHDVTVTVTDGTSLTDSQDVAITVTDTVNIQPTTNDPPTAEAGPDLSVDEGGSITLQGSGSDDDGDDLTYSWSQDSRLSFDNSSSATPTVTAFPVTANTTITLTLTVDDGTTSGEDTMDLTIRDLDAPITNTPPTANAGPDRSVDKGGSITLQGSGSDPDGNDSDLTYLWSQLPATPVISFDNRISATPEITAPSVTAETEITLILRVYDGTDYTTDAMALTILNVTAATVNVGPDQTVKEGATVIMPWTASGPDGESLTYSWSQDPLLPGISLNSENLSPTTFTAPDVDADTAFTFTLVVTAGQRIAEDSLTVTVKNNRPPTVDAGANRTVNERTAVTLSGSASDPDGDTMTYAWTHDSGTSVNLTGSDTTRPQFTAPGVTSDEGIVFTFTVTDTASESADDTVTVTVRDVPISVLSATYNPGNGQLVITFNQDINSANYSAIHIRSTGSDSGGIALSDISGASHLGRIITATLDSEQQKEYGDLGSPQLDIEDGAVTDVDGVLITQVSDMPISDASRKKSSSSSKAPAVHIGALIQTRTVDIPPHIVEQVKSHDGSDPLEPLIPDGTFEFPLVINGYGYLLDDTTNTLVPQTVTAGDDDPTIITFTMYTQKDLAHFTLYLNLSDENTDYADSDTYITYKNDDGTTDVTDPHGYIDSATITVTQEDDQAPERKTVQITIEFGEESMDPTNMVAYMWNTDRKATFIKIIDAFEVVAAPQEPVIQVADLKPVPTDDQMPADSEPVPTDDQMPADSEPVPYAILGSDDYDDAQVLQIIRMWSGFESETITDAQLLASLGFDYPDADIPIWMMTELGVLVAKGDVTVNQFVLALQYVLEHA